MWTLFASSCCLSSGVHLFPKNGGLFDRTQAKLYSIRASRRLPSVINFNNQRTCWTIFCGNESHSLQTT